MSYYTLQPGVKYDLPLVGSYIYIETALSPVEVSVNGRDHEFKAGQGIPVIAGFNRVTVRTTGAVADTVNIVVEDQEFIDHRALGTVQVAGTVSVDQITPDSKDVFTAYMGIGVPAANYMYAAIENPVGSGKTIGIKNTWFNSDNAGIVRLGYMDAHPAHTTYSAPVPLRLAGVNDSVAVLKVGYMGALVNHDLALLNYYQNIGDTLMSPFGSYIVLNEGQILSYRFDTVGAIIVYPSFEWEEY